MYYYNRVHPHVHKNLPSTSDSTSSRTPATLGVVISADHNTPNTGEAHKIYYSIHHRQLLPRNLQETINGLVYSITIHIRRLARVHSHEFFKKIKNKHKRTAVMLLHVDNIKPSCVYGTLTCTNRPAMSNRCATDVDPTLFQRVCPTSVELQWVSSVGPTLASNLILTLDCDICMRMSTVDLTLVQHVCPTALIELRVSNIGPTLVSNQIPTMKEWSVLIQHPTLSNELENFQHWTNASNLIRTTIVIFLCGYPTLI